MIYTNVNSQRHAVVQPPLLYRLLSRLAFRSCTLFPLLRVLHELQQKHSVLWLWYGGSSLNERRGCESLKNGQSLGEKKARRDTIAMAECSNVNVQVAVRCRPLNSR